MSSPALKKFTSAGVPPERLHGVQSAARAKSASSSQEQQLLGLQGKAGNQAVQLVLDEAGLEHAIRNLPRLPSGNAAAVLRRYLAYIENRIISGEGRIQALMALRAESFSNYLIGGAIEVFGGTSLPSNDWKDAWNLINRGRDEIQRGQLKEALETLVSASKATTAHWKSLNDHLDSTDKGMDRSVFTLQVLQAAGALAATALTGGGATAVVVGAGYGATQNLAGQATSVAIGTQGKIDWSGMAFDTLFGVLTGAAGGRLGNAVLKRLMGKPAVASLGRRVIAEVVSDLVSGRLSSILHTVGRGLIDELRGKEQLTVDQFIERLADQLMDPKEMFIDTLMGRASKIAHASKAPGRTKRVSMNSLASDKTTDKQGPILAAGTPLPQSKHATTELKVPDTINHSLPLKADVELPLPDPNAFKAENTDIGTLTRHRRQAKRGDDVISEHGQPGAQWRAVSTDSNTGRTLYDDAAYEADFTIRSPKKTADWKTHEGSRSDNKRTTRINEKIAKGEPVNLVDDILLPSIEQQRAANAATGRPLTDSQIVAQQMAQFGEKFDLVPGTTAGKRMNAQRKGTTLVKKYQQRMARAVASGDPKQIKAAKAWLEKQSNGLRSRTEELAATGLAVKNEGIVDIDWEGTFAE